MTASAQERFQALARELFHFDCADLDFGIYRVMNVKRALIETFITEDLPKTIKEELDRGALAEQEWGQKALEQARKEALPRLGEHAPDLQGDLKEAFREAPVGKTCQKAQESAQGARSAEALETAVYNRLYTFFSRYWQDGDFISKRRSSKKDRYAIPYNGEEVYLYWANRDQYYIKTGERFTDYSYKDPRGVAVHFKLQHAKVEQNNVKGEERFFLPALDGIVWCGAARALTIPFEFRPLTEQERNKYGQKNRQEAIIAEAVAEISKRVKDADASSDLTDARPAPNPAPSPFGGGGENDHAVSLLKYHLRQYARRNAGDFFIHKDLRGFLSRELDFYLKNEVLNLDEMEAAGEQLAEGWFQLMRLIKRVGGRIIDFLAQIEDFQKMLWEKKKFVTETFYVITVGNVPEAFYPEIAACEAQWEEWEALLTVETPKGAQKRVEFLNAHPALPLDTRHFSPDFTDRLLASFDNLDEMTDGLLVHSENWQALNLLQASLVKSVKAAYSDPPYNTSEETFVYKNNYRHSSWLAMMHNVIAVLRRLLSEDGALVIAIDDTELYHLKLVADGVMGDDNYLGTIVVQSNPRGRGIHSYYATSHDYYLVYASASRYARIINQPLTEEQTQDYRYSDDVSIYRLLPFRRSGGLSTPAERPNSEFTLYYSESVGRIIGVGGEREKNYPEKYTPKSIFCVLGDTFDLQELSPSEFWKLALKDTVEIFPIDTDKSRRVWRWSDRQKALQAAFAGEFVVQRTPSGISVLLKDRIKEGRKPKTVWTDSKYDASSHGTNLLQDIIGTRGLFGYPKSIYSTSHALHSIVGNDGDSVILDAFAGSGTTGHAVINLNREDGGRRKFILVEMEHYFDTVLLPRIKKVTFSPEWKDGKPKRMATAEEAERSPRIVKVIRLESYEDALNNLTFDDEGGRKALERFKDDYLLHYMLRWETRRSETMLDVEKLQTPFAYKLRLHRDGETREQPVDLSETFNYLLRLDVQTRRVLPSPHPSPEGGEGAAERRARGTYLVYRGALRNGRAVAVIWRETQGWTKEDYERDRDFVAEQKLTDGADDVFVNGDSLIPGAQSLDSMFKERMFAGGEG